MRIWPETKFKPGDAIRFHRNRLLCYVVVSKASLAAADAAAAGSQGVASDRVASDPVASGGVTCQGMPMNVSTGVEGTGQSPLLVEEQGSKGYKVAVQQNGVIDLLRRITSVVRGWGQN